MTATIIDGKETAREKREQLAKEVEELKKQGVTPGLAVILIGDDPASHSYVRGKKKAAETMGMNFKLDQFDSSLTEAELLSIIDQYNQDPEFHGILVQLPLPDHISEKAVIERISPDKDVDGFHPLNVGKMLLGEDTFLPCTPHGIVELLKKTNIDLSGKEVVVVGRSNIVGKPVGQLLLNENATVTYCHSRTENITEHTKKRTSWWWQSAEPTSSVQTRSKRALLSLTSALTVWKTESFAETLNLKGQRKKRPS